jgi:SNF2 family DNA or RNA helicase
LRLEEHSIVCGIRCKHWFAPPAPEVRQVELRWPVTVQASAWNEELGRAIRPEAWRIGLEIPPPRAVSIAIRPPFVAVRSFRFPEPAEDEIAGRDSQLQSPPRSRGAFPLPAATTTRIYPPQDVVKLQDRLHYLLQPPLETLLADGRMPLPLRPFPFQLAGIAFLYPRHAAILADEMGLGKTMQAITAIRLLVRRGEVRSVLLVCPKPLVPNWQREFQQWAPEIPVLAIEGEQAKRAWQWRLPDVPVRVANYELVVRDREILEGGSSGRRMRFDLVVLDEAQRIKNRAGTTSEVLRGLPRRRSWTLTGTPVENSSEDLVGIFEFLAPGFLSPELTPRRMGRTVSDYVLRRTKEQVLGDMPPLLFRDADLELAPEQRATYRLAEEEGVIRLTELGAAATIRHVFELVLRLKQICNFDPASGASSKLERLEADLEETATSGRKAIIFSQWVATLRRLAAALERFGPLEYHGQVPQGRRQTVLRRFREDPSRQVLLMTYGAGGVGLNLQFAHYVFLFDRWWNPAVEDQAINRAHRIGSAGPVTVSRLLVLDTIEERIEHILQEKRALFETIFSGARGPRRLGLTEQELFGLFHLRPQHGVGAGRQTDQQAA